MFAPARARHGLHSTASPLDVPLHPDLGMLAQRGEGFFATSRASASSAACSDLSLI